MLCMFENVFEICFKDMDDLSGLISVEDHFEGIVFRTEWQGPFVKIITLCEFYLILLL